MATQPELQGCLHTVRFRGSVLKSTVEGARLCEAKTWLYVFLNQHKLRKNAARATREAAKGTILAQLLLGVFFNLQTFRLKTKGQQMKGSWWWQIDRCLRTKQVTSRHES